jgi:UDP-glucose 4-epimerase
MNILISGSSGLVGNQVLEIFNSSDLIERIYAIDLMPPKKNYKKVVFIKNNIFDREALTELFEPITIDSFIHLVGSPSVWKSEQDPMKDLEINLFSLLSILRFAKDISLKRVIFSSSCQVIETLQNAKKTNYGISKYMAEIYIKKICEDLNIDFCILRPSWIYGPNMVKNPIYDIIEAYKNGNTKMFIAEDSSLDFVYSKDVALAFFKAATERDWGNRTLNISSNKSIKIKKIKKIVEEITEKKIHLTFPRDLEAEEIKYDNSEAIALGWKCKYAVKQGIQEMIEISKKNLKN